MVHKIQGLVSAFKKETTQWGRKTDNKSHISEARTWEKISRARRPSLGNQERLLEGTTGGSR